MMRAFSVDVGGFIEPHKSLPSLCGFLDYCVDFVCLIKNPKKSKIMSIDPVSTFKWGNSSLSIRGMDGPWQVKKGSLMMRGKLHERD